MFFKYLSRKTEVGTSDNVENDTGYGTIEFKFGCVSHTSDEKTCFLTGDRSWKTHYHTHPMCLALPEKGAILVSLACPTCKKITPFIVKQRLTTLEKRICRIISMVGGLFVICPLLVCLFLCILTRSFNTEYVPLYILSIIVGAIILFNVDIPKGPTVSFPNDSIESSDRQHRIILPLSGETKSMLDEMEKGSSRMEAEPH